jgi:hypothetical protein
VRKPISSSMPPKVLSKPSRARFESGRHLRYG